MKRSIRMMVCTAAVAVASVLALAGCSQPAAQQEGSSGEASSVAVAPTGSDVAGASTDTSSVFDESAELPVSQGAIYISLGDRNLLQVRNSDAGVVADAVLEVRNTGDVPLMLVDGTLSIFDENAEEVLTLTGDDVCIAPSSLNPGDVGFLYTKAPVALPEGCSADAKYELTGNASMVPCEGVWEYRISDVVLSDDGNGAPMLTGKVTNDDTELAERIEITAVFLDNERNMLGVASDVVVNLEPGGITDFTINGNMVPAGCTMAVIAGYDAIAVAPKF